MLYFTLILNSLSGYRNRTFGFLAILLFASVAIFRGSTGTDTASYESIFSELSLETIWDSVEPGFALLGLFLTEILGSAQAGVRAVSALFFLLIAFYYLQAERNEAFVLLTYFAPAYFYIYSMNGLRIGIASIILLLAIQALRRGHVLKGSASMIIAIFFHYTILFSIGYFIINFFNQIKLKYVLLLGLLILSFFYFANEYISLKLSTYSDYELPNELSGLSKVVVIFLLILGVLFSGLPSALRIRIILSTLLFAGFAIAVTTFSYAGLRFLDLITFILPTVILMFHFEAKQPFNWRMKLSFLVAGFASAATVYRGFLMEAHQGESPFLPYELLDFFKILW